MAYGQTQFRPQGLPDTAPVADAIRHMNQRYREIAQSLVLYPASRTEARYVRDPNYPPGDVRRYGAVLDGVTDDSQAFANAFLAQDTSGGRGAVVTVPSAAVSLGTTGLALRDNVPLLCAGRRPTIFTYAGSGAVVTVDSVTHTGILGGARLSLGSSPTAIGLDLKTTSASCLLNDFDSLEITSSSVAGQIGVRAVTSGSNIISANTVRWLNLQNVDRPMLLTGPEGNFWLGFTIDTFGHGNSGALAIEATTHDDLFLGRIAGTYTGTTNHYGFQQGGDENHAILTCDHGGLGGINLLGGYNSVQIRLPELLTPLGTVGTNNTVNAPQMTYLPGLALPLGGGTGVVSVGAADSGGVGFRVLRVPN